MNVRQRLTDPEFLERIGGNYPVVRASREAGDAAATIILRVFRLPRERICHPS